MSPVPTAKRPLRGCLHNAAAAGSALRLSRHTRLSVLMKLHGGGNDHSRGSRIARATCRLCRAGRDARGARSFIARLVAGRVDGVSFDAALFTNLTRDHLDYHGDMRVILRAKARLFLTIRPAQDRQSRFGIRRRAGCAMRASGRVSTDVDRVANGDPYVFVRSIDANEQGSRSVSQLLGRWQFHAAIAG